LKSSHLTIKIQPKIIKYVLIFTFIIFLNQFFVNEVFANSHNKEDASLPLVSLQLQLRNSEGQQVAYIEPTDLYFLDLKGFHNFLDTQDKSSIMYHGKLHELIEFKQIQYFSESYKGQAASYNLYFEGKVALAYRHDGYIPQSGDTLYISWKIIRTI